MPSLTVSIAIPLEQGTLNRLQASAQILRLSASAVIACAAEELANAISRGWRPKLVPPAGPAYLAFHAPAELRAMIEAAALTSGIKKAELNRLSVWAALYKMEGRKQVLWPFTFTKKQLNEVVRLYSG